jgi:hypothetical protein
MPVTRAGAGCARPARRASTTSPARFWPAITSRCGSLGLLRPKLVLCLYFMGLNLSNRRITWEAMHSPKERERIERARPLAARGLSTMN